MNIQWSNRLITMFINSYYAINGFPNWILVVRERYFSVYHRWYGL